MTPTYHTGDAFTSAGDLLIFATARQGMSALCKADTATGEITSLIDPVCGTGSAKELHEADGHVSAMVDRLAVIIDGNLTDDTLFWLYYDQESPRLEVIGRHDTNWIGMPWQYPHPHAHCSPDGRHISYNAAAKGWTGRGRSDVWLMEI